MPRDTARKALVVDDDQGIVETLVIALKREGFECRTASNGVMALNRLRTFHADVVVTDLLMDKMHGHRLVTALAAFDPRPVAVVLTAVREARLIKDLIARGAADVMLKPVAAELVAAKVRALLDARDTARVAGKAPGPMGLDALREGISSTAGELRSQLRQITEEFEHTVRALESENALNRDGMVGSVRLFSQLIRMLGSCEGSHTSRVEHMCVALATKTGMSEKERLCLRVAALVHDLGQLGMPDFVRNKAPWDLSPAEREIYRKYPSIGANLVECIPKVRESASVIDAHCENYDGSGFPRNLKGREIPLGARILRIADGCDTLRIFGKQLPDATSLAEHLREQSGISYDPELVEIAVDYFSHHEPVRENVIITEVLEPGMVLAESIYDSDGCYLIGNGVSLTASLAARISRMAPGRTFHVYARPDEASAPGHSA